MRALVAVVALTTAAASKKEKKPSGHGADVAAFVRGAHKADDANVAKAKRAVHDGLAECRPVDPLHRSCTVFAGRAAGPGCGVPDR